MSRSLMPGSWAMHTRTRAWLVRKAQLGVAPSAMSLSGKASNVKLESKIMIYLSSISRGSSVEALVWGSEDNYPREGGRYMLSKTHPQGQHSLACRSRAWAVG